eukprot:gene14638-19661_t
MKKNLVFLLLVWDFISNINGFVKQFLKQSPALVDQHNLQWRRLPSNLAIYGNFTLSHCRSLNVPTPSYVQILTQDTLSVTSFSLLRKGSIMNFDLNGIYKPRIMKGDYLWPNELNSYVDRDGHTVLLIPDGFLMPGQNDGGLYAIRDPHDSKSKPVRISAPKHGWFYHRAIYIKLPNGNEGILTARAHKPLFGKGMGELIWLVAPNNTNSIDSPWIESILIEGPDVMFETIDLDNTDDCIEVIATHFFNKKLSIHSMRGLSTYPYAEIVNSSTIDTIGQPYGICLATFDDHNDSNHGIDMENQVDFSVPAVMKPWHSGTQNKYRLDNKINKIRYKSKKSVYNSLDKFKDQQNNALCDNSRPTHILVTTHECSYDLKSTLNMAYSAMEGSYPLIKSNMLVSQSINFINDQKIDWGSSSIFGSTSNEGNGVLTNSDAVSGGSLFAYKIPSFHLSSKTSNKLTTRRINNQNNVDSNLCNVDLINTSPRLDASDWKRHTLLRGFKVRGWGGIFSPGAPGFPYVFRMPNKPQSPPLILLAGDCTGSAYIFAPSPTTTESSDGVKEPIPQYELAYEIECGATVGSAAVTSTNDGSGDVNLYIPSYELNKVHVFRLSEK